MVKGVARPFLSDAAKAALLGAVRDVEARSRAEVVIVVRPASASYREAALTGALLGVFAALGVMLYSPWEFGLAWFLLDPALAGVVAGLAVHHSPFLVRRLTASTGRREAVHRAALATFVDRGVTATRERTGLLLYVSLLERRAEVVADRGILAAVEPTTWARQVEALVMAVAEGADGAAVAEHLRGLGGPLAQELPVGDDDVNELPDEVVAP
jgi:putative membrane protein